MPSITVVREVLIRVDPDRLDQALRAWNAQFAAEDEGLAIDGKTLCNAIGLIQANSRDTVASTLQRLACSPRMVLDYLRLSTNALRSAPGSAA